MHEVTLPEGIASHYQWGRTLITFGKYEKKMSYAEFVASGDTEYIDYLCSHYSSTSSPQFKDLVMYLRAVCQKPAPVAGYYPGSVAARALK